jgi:hypothetical protein
MGVIVKLQHKMSKAIYSHVFGLFILAVLALSSVSALTFSGSLTGENAVPLFVGANRTVSLVNDVAQANVLPLSLTDATASRSPTTVTTSGSTPIKVLVDSVFGTFKIGDVVTSTLTAVENGNSSNNATLPVDFVRSFCKNGDAGRNLSIDSIDVSSDGTEDLEWMPLDTVTVKVKVENNADDDVRDVVIEIGLIDETTGKNRIGDVEFVSVDEEKNEYGRINDGDNAKVEFQFQIPADFDDGDYRLVVKVYSDNLKEQNECADFSADLDNTFYQSITVNKQNDEGKYIAFDNVELTPVEATCGETVVLSATAFNVGEDDQDKVKIDLYNKNLGIDASSEIGSLDMGDSQAVSFTFKVPQGLADGVYKIELSSEYDYRNGLYRQEADTSEDVSLKVMGCSATVPQNTGAVSISASLDSEAQAGKPLVVSTTLTNRLGKTASFVVDAAGYDSWATLSSISSRMVTLGAGESKDVTLTFDVNSDAEGQHAFNVIASTGTSEDSKQVVVSLAKASTAGFSLSSLSGSNLIWVIAAINLVLLLIIIFVAVRLARR